MKTIFIFAYYSLKDPVFQSAVLPYFENFPEKKKFRFIILTFEQEQFKLGQKEAEITKRELKENHNVIWHSATWHSGSFKLIKKAFDFCWSLIFSFCLILKYNADFIYSEGFPGAIIGHYLSKISSRKHIVHTFEPHADYMIESGVWGKNSWEAKLIKRLEKKIVKQSYAILTATHKMINKYKPISPTTLFYRVPSCVDLDLFQYSMADREYYRKQWYIEENTCLLVYLGKFGGMYWEEELFDLFETFQKHSKIKFKLLVISQENQKRFEHRLNKNIIWFSAQKKEVAGLLSAADLAICGIHNIPSRRYSSPIKNGEYWATGLPVIIPKGISEDYLYAEENSIGYILNEINEQGFNDCLREIEKKFILNCRLKKARLFVEEDRSVESYKSNIYYPLLSGGKEV